MNKYFDGIHQRRKYTILYLEKLFTSIYLTYFIDNLLMAWIPIFTLDKWIYVSNITIQNNTYLDSILKLLWCLKNMHSFKIWKNNINTFKRIFEICNNYFWKRWIAFMIYRVLCTSLGTSMNRCMNLKCFHEVLKCFTNILFYENVENLNS